MTDAIFQAREPNCHPAGLPRAMVVGQEAPISSQTPPDNVRCLGSHGVALTWTCFCLLVPYIPRARLELPLRVFLWIRWRRKVFGKTSQGSFFRSWISSTLSTWPCMARAVRSGVMERERQTWLVSWGQHVVLVCVDTECVGTRVRPWPGWAVGSCPAFFSYGAWEIPGTGNNVLGTGKTNGLQWG